MQTIKDWLSTFWTWFKDRAVKSWTMLGLTVAGVVTAADQVVPFIPDEYKNKPMFFVFLLTVGILRARTL